MRMKKWPVVLLVFVAFCLCVHTYQRVLAKPVIRYDGQVLPLQSPVVVQGGRVYVPVAGVLAAEGFEAVRNELYRFHHTFKDYTIAISVSDARIQKDSVAFLAASGEILERDGELYIERGLMEKIICKQISAQKTGIEIKTPKIHPNGWVYAANALVAHAGGGLDGDTYINSTDAIVHHYEKGNRVFEFDMNMTIDGHLVGIHDWSGQEAPTLAAFMERKIQGKYRATALEDVIRLMWIHEDMYLVTDTKSFGLTDQEITEQFTVLYETVLQYDKSILKRIIPQIYNQPMYAVINAVYPYESIIYTLYETPDTEQQVVDFIKKEGIGVVTMAPPRANKPFLKNIYKNNAKVFVHTINSLEEVEMYQKLGIWGFYTDFLFPGDMSRHLMSQSVPAMTRSVNTRMNV